MRRFTHIAFFWLAAMGCGMPVTSGRVVNLGQALSAPSEVLERDSRETRQELFRELARQSQDEFGKPVEGPILFPLVLSGAVSAAPGLSVKQDLFGGLDAGSKYQLSFDGDDFWPEERREALWGLSEREAVEPIARALLSHWGIGVTGNIRVERTRGAPYAAAYLDGTLRINPSFIYMAVAAVGASGP